MRVVEVVVNVESLTVCVQGARTVRDGNKKSPIQARLLRFLVLALRAGPGKRMLNVFAAPPPA